MTASSIKEEQNNYKFRNKNSFKSSFYHI